MSDQFTSFCGAVLVVDNHEAAETLAQLVELLWDDPHVAYDGPSALRIARERLPDVVLCDIGLPGMSGYDASRASSGASRRTTCGSSR